MSVMPHISLSPQYGNLVINQLKDDRTFEEFTVSFFNELNASDNYSIYGRSGQRQHGIDVTSKKDRIAIQCKVRQLSYTWEQLKEDLTKDFHSFVAHNKSLGGFYSTFIFASTWKSDVKLDDYCTLLARRYSIDVEYYSWERFTNQLIKLPETAALFMGYLLDSRPIYKSDLLSSTLQPMVAENLDSLKIKLYTFFDRLDDHLKCWPSRFYIEELRGCFSLSSNSYKSSFTLKIQDDKVNQALLAIINESNECDSILTHFRNNLILSINDKSLDTQNDKEFCDCLECRYQRYDYSGILSQDVTQSSNSEVLAHSYYAYRIGSDLKAARQLLKIEVENDLGMVYDFIKVYNLKVLRNAFRIKPNEALKKQIDQLDPNKIIARYQGQPGSYILDYINKFEFFDDALYRINELTESIVTAYYLEKRGGTSMDSFSSVLLAEFYQFYHFLTKNYICYEAYSNFEKLVHRFLEGWVASHSRSINSSYGVAHLDNFVATIIINHSKAKYFTDLCHRYEVKGLRYEQGSNEHITILFKRFHESMKLINASLIDDFSVGMINLCERYSKFIDLFALIDLTKEQASSVCSILMEVRDIKILHDRVPSYKFISKHVDLLSWNDCCRLLIKELSTTDKFGISDNVRALAYNLRYADDDNGMSKQLTPQLEEMVVKFSANAKTSELIICSYLLQDERITFRERLTNIILSALKNDFDCYLCYFACFHGQIEFTDELITSFRKIAKPPKNFADTQLRFGHKHPFRYNKLDRFIDVCLAHDIELSQFTEFKIINEYYHWLFDIEKFDYQNFDPKWVLDGTKTFYRHLKQYKKVLDQLKSYNQENNDPEVLRAYFNIIS